MTRLHADDIAVERGVIDSGGVDSGGVDSSGGHRIEGPVRFRWGQHSYVVQARLDHWTEAGNWWQRAGRAGPAGSVLGIDDGEREVWRVEAGWRSGSMGVYDLRFEWGTGRWSLIRVHD